MPPTAPLRRRPVRPGVAAVYVVLMSLVGIASNFYPQLYQKFVDNSTSEVVRSEIDRSPYYRPIKPDYTIPPVTDGLAPVLTRIPTKQPVVFLGIDDGAHKKFEELQIMRKHRVRASLFLSDLFIRNNPGFFRHFVNAGSLVENHSVSHEDLTTMTYEQQRQEICNEADNLQRLFGRRPVLFRPPFGAYNTDTRRAAADCGMKAIVNWIAKANGGSMQYQVGDKLQPGDIVLMHFRPEFAQDMQAFLDAQNAAGLHTDLLTNWLPKESTESGSAN